MQQTLKLPIKLGDASKAIANAGNSSDMPAVIEFRRITEITVVQSRIDLSRRAALAINFRQ